MKVIFECPTCGEEIEKDAALAPSYVNCPKCEAAVMAPMVAIGPGMTLGGFRIEKAIGRGSMGQVFLATQLSMDRKVALKVLPPDAVTDESLVKRFLHEVRMLAKVEHPNLVAAFEAGEDQGVYFLAMSYVDGESLANRIEREGKILEKEALEIILKVAHALSYVWDTHQILHNDIKPANIMIDSRSEVRIMDMGLSKGMFEKTGLSLTGVAFGTPNFMSPEVACGKEEVDLRSDEFALGSTLYRMVTGKMPFQGESVPELLSNKLNEPAPPARSVNPELSEECEVLLEILLSKHPDDRYRTWTEVISNIERVLDGELPEDPCVEEVQAVADVQFDKERSFRRTAIIGILGVLVIVAAAAAVLLRDKQPVAIEVSEDEPVVETSAASAEFPPVISIIQHEPELHKDEWHVVKVEVLNLAKPFQDFEPSNETSGEYFLEVEGSRVRLVPPPDPPPLRSSRALSMQGNAVRINPMSSPVNLSQETHLGVWVYDTLGNNPVQLRLRDSSGAEQQVWSAMSSKRGEWTLIIWPFSSFTSVNRSSIENLELREFKRGIYIFDNVFSTTESDITVELKDGAGAVRSANTIDGVIYADGLYDVWVHTPTDLVQGWEYYYNAFFYANGVADAWRSKYDMADTAHEQPWIPVTR